MSAAISSACAARIARSRAGRVVLGQPGDLVEEHRPAGVVEPLRRQVLRGGAQPGADVGLQRPAHGVGGEVAVERAHRGPSGTGRRGGDDGDRCRRTTAAAVGDVGPARTVVVGLRGHDDRAVGVGAVHEGVAPGGGQRRVAVGGEQVQTGPGVGGGRPAPPCRPARRPGPSRRAGDGRPAPRGRRCPPSSPPPRALPRPPAGPPPRRRPRRCGSAAPRRAAGTARRRPPRRGRRRWPSGRRASSTEARTDGRERGEGAVRPERHVAAVAHRRGPPPAGTSRPRTRRR